MLLHNKQREIVSSPARFKVVRAGRRSGKTILEVEDMSFTAIDHDDSPVFYIAPTQTQARSIIWESLKNRLAGVGEAHEQRLEMRVPTIDGGTSLIAIAGWENRENFRGRKAKKIYFDEVDTMQNFFIGWQEIFRPALVDYKGGAMFTGTPKKENPNLRRLEKLADVDRDYAAFHFTSYDNPHVPRSEIDKAREELDADTFAQEMLAEYLDFLGALFHFDALVDVFSNTIEKTADKYMIVDVADDGSDRTVFSFWEGLEEYRRDEYSRLNTEGIVDKIREYASLDKIPFSHIAVDAIGVGAAVASNSMLDGIIGFKSSYSAIKTDHDIVRLPNVSYRESAPILTSDYKNLRSQCIFLLAEHVNNHKIASRVTGRNKEIIIEELQHYQDASKGDGKRMAMQKEEVRELIGRSPDHSDTWIMRMYFEVRKRVSPNHSPEFQRLLEQQNINFTINRKNNLTINSAR